MYFPQNTTIKHFAYHLFPQTFLCVPFTSCLFKKITHRPPRAACLLYEHICLSRTSFYVLCEMLNDFVADNYRNILRASIFDCSGFLCAREYHFSSEGYKNRLEWTKSSVLKNAFSLLSLDCFWCVLLCNLYKWCIKKIVWSVWKWGGGCGLERQNRSL